MPVILPLIMIMLAFVVCVICVMLCVMLFVSFVADPVDRFRRGLADKYIHESWLTGFLITRFKIRKMSRPNGGIALQFRSPFTRWETMDTYGSADYEQGRLQEDLAGMWKAVHAYVERMKFVPVVEELVMPGTEEVVAPTEPVVEEKE